MHDKNKDTVSFRKPKKYFFKWLFFDSIAKKEEANYLIYMMLHNFI